MGTPTLDTPESTQINDRGTWMMTTYAVGDSYTYGGLRYYVKTAYTSGGAFGSTDTTNTIILGAQTPPATAAFALVLGGM